LKSGSLPGKKADKHFIITMYPIQQFISKKCQRRAHYSQKYSLPMSIIEFYSFGRMVIEGQQYSKDVIIFPDGSILSPWWRRQGHVLTAADLEKLIKATPEIIICGTGAMGVMRPAVDLREYLQSLNIDFIVEKSGKAVEIFNRLSGTRKTGGCFHLTC
jgi:hypothetical protein